MDKLWITILVLLIIVLWQSYLLFKKPTTHNEIAKSVQKTKRNRDSNIKNDITPTINVKPDKKAKKQRLKNYINKRKLKKEANEIK